MSELTKKQKTRRLAESAIMIALSAVLSEFAVVNFPQGGSVTVFSQVPLVLLSYRYGVKWGAFSGLALAVIQLLFGLENFSYVSGIVSYIILLLADYLIAFTALGFGGMFRKSIKNQTISLALGGTVVSLIRYACHFVSGITIWQAYAGDLPVWKYSLIYNGGYMLPELIVTVVGLVIVSMAFDMSNQEIKTKIGKKTAENAKLCK